MFTKQEYDACRACDKLLAILTDGWAEAENCDAHWDGGEWSGPVWADNWEEVHGRVVKLVAIRFDIEDDALFDIWFHHRPNDQAYKEHKHLHEVLRSKQDENLRLMCGFDPKKEEL